MQIDDVADGLDDVEALLDKLVPMLPQGWKIPKIMQGNRILILDEEQAGNFAADQSELTDFDSVRRMLGAPAPMAFMISSRADF